MMPLLTATETISIIRDIVIILFTGVLFLFTLALALFGFLMYRKVSPLIDTAKKAAKNAEDISTNISQKLVKPMVSRSIFALGAGQILSFILGISRKKGGGKKNG